MERVIRILFTKTHLYHLSNSRYPTRCTLSVNTTPAARLKHKSNAGFPPGNNRALDSDSEDPAGTFRSRRWATAARAVCRRAQAELAWP